MDAVLNVRNFYWQEAKGGGYNIEIPISDVALHNTVERALEVNLRYGTYLPDEIRFSVLIDGGIEAVGDKIKCMVECALDYILFGVSDPSKNPSISDGWELYEVEWTHQSILDQLDNLQRESSGEPDKIPGMTDWDWQALKESRYAMYCECGGAFANLKLFGEKKGLTS